MADMTEEEFKNIVLPHSRLMFSCAKGILCDNDDVHDCLQESYAGLWNNRGRLLEIGNVRGYCLAVVRNSAMQMIRLRKISIPVEEAHINEGIQNYSVETRDELKLALRLVAELDERKRRVLELNAMSGLSASEIAEATGLSNENVRVLLSRARKEMRDRWIAINKLNKEK